MVTTETCFKSAEFNSYWDEVYQVLFQYDSNITPDYGWMLDTILNGFNTNRWTEFVALSIIKDLQDDYPGDEELIANNSCGTAWHDGCR